jgi:hypothetical protein
MAGQQPVEDGRKRPYAAAIPMIRHCAILIEIAGTSPAMTPRVLLLLRLWEPSAGYRPNVAALTLHPHPVIPP